jgi:hypothetical protein
MNHNKNEKEIIKRRSKCITGSRIQSPRDSTSPLHYSEQVTNLANKNKEICTSYSFTIHFKKYLHI